MGRFLICLCLALSVLAVSAQSSRRRPKKDDASKIVGGKDADITHAPYQVSLQYNPTPSNSRTWQHICGGSIIAQQYILTAAHCTDGMKPENLRIRSGSTYHNSGGDTYNVRSIINHPQYNARTTDNDIAILRTDPIAKSNQGRAIALATSEPKSGNVFITGWGLTSEGGSTSRNLKGVVVPVISRESCTRSYSSFNKITPGMWCAGLAEGGKDACQGDSGGPAVVDGFLNGVVSWGAGCARRGAPGVYANVPYFLSWIKSNTGNAVRTARS